MEQFDADRREVITRAIEVGITQLLQVGCNLEESRTVLALAERLRQRELTIRLATDPLDAATATAALAGARTCLACLGPQTGGPWQEGATRDVLAAKVRHSQITLLAFLLPGAQRPEKESALPFFLRRQSWPRFPNDEVDLDALVARLDAQVLQFH